MQSNPLLLAAQSKLAIAHFIGDPDMWCQAMESMKVTYESTRHVEDDMFCGRINPLSELNVRDISLNFDTYGDLISVNADLLTAQYKINTEVSF
ncbi:MAG: hypothetical protein P0Y63_03990 [Klebsiella huaxiensis]|uniref:host cell division inhibitory peptide Kil n=1 Tax=Klebsiella huaxiensis TaxID=2153354 RepID=UPI0026F135E5|nr:hypothetical protein [Klebsiella huaxiensis]WEJ90187.1 MAG: hypothetical protein P0Y63_03990 [Klebsiella huaxiensis]